MKSIKNRGRTLDAVFNPKHYAPFSGIVGRAAFKALWHDRPEAVLAHISHAAYCAPSYLTDLFEGFGATITFYHSHADAHGIIRGREAFLVVWPDKAVLAFRGTQAGQALAVEWQDADSDAHTLRLPFIPTDIVDDLNFMPHNYSEAGGASQFHRGFFNATSELWPEIYTDLAVLNLTDPAQLFVTGHSLGAAMAVVAAAFHPFKQVVTFGEPAVGNHLDCTIASGCAHVRYVNGHDPVTKIVPDWLYHHHGELRAITDSDGPDFRYDHSIINYGCILTAHELG